MGLDYRRYFQRETPPDKQVYLVLGVKKVGGKPIFTFLDAQTKSEKQSTSLQMVVVDIDDLKQHDYGIVVRQDHAHKNGWLKRYTP